MIRKWIGISKSKWSTGTLTTLWSGPNNFSSNNEDIANLNNGTYTLHIEDDYSCAKDTIFTIQEPDSLFAYLVYKM